MPLVREDAHHNTLESTLDLRSHINPLTGTLDVFNYRNADFDHLNRSIGEIGWRVVLNNSNTNVDVSHFYDHLYGLLNQHIPKRHKGNKQFPHWYSPATIKCIRERIKTHRKWKLYNNNIDYLTFLYYAFARKSSSQTTTKCT